MPIGLRPFLSVFTPTYRRPELLAKCAASVEAQTFPVQHVIIEDTVGLGIDGMYAAMPQHAHKPIGEYVMVLSDDNVLADEYVANNLEVFARANREPDVIVFKGDIEGCVQPLVWHAEPEITRIDLSCFAVRREIWRAHSDAWGHRYEGDFDFIHTLWDLGYRFAWWDRLVFRALQISRGMPEAA